MSNRLDPEQERLIRLRQKQLADRDPGVKQKEFNRMATARERKVDRRITAGRMWKTLSHAWRGAFIGLLLGVFVMVILPSLWVSDRALPAALGILFILIVLGIVVGKSFDYRDNLNHLSK
jgi:hypothetical protein